MMIPRIINDVNGLEAFRNQLKASHLPHEDLSNDHLLIGYYDNDQLIGTGGIEVHEEYGLIRSVSITNGNRSKKLGTQITHHLILQAKEKNLKGLYLLTETARDFFLKFGFELIERDQVAEAIKSSTEFSHVCPVSASCMYLDFKRSC
ncbi:MAG: arsenic resistance N-acetyltransferase ArsN2 [Cyclobacteriaceae bacterium]